MSAINRRATEALIELVEGYPYFAQLYAMETWRSAGTPSDRPGTVITPRDVEDAIGPTRARLEEGLLPDPLRQGLRNGSRATSGPWPPSVDGRIPSGGCGPAVGIDPRKLLSSFRDRVDEQGNYLLPRPTTCWSFSVPGFASYVRRRPGIGRVAGRLHRRAARYTHHLSGDYGGWRKVHLMARLDIPEGRTAAMPSSCGRSDPKWARRSTGWWTPPTTRASCPSGSREAARECASPS